MLRTLSGVLFLTKSCFIGTNPLIRENTLNEFWEVLVWDTEGIEEKPWQGREGWIRIEQQKKKKIMKLLN